MSRLREAGVFGLLVCVLGMAGCYGGNNLGFGQVQQIKTPNGMLGPSSNSAAPAANQNSTATQLPQPVAPANNQTPQGTVTPANYQTPQGTVTPANYQTPAFPPMPASDLYPTQPGPTNIGIVPRGQIPEAPPALPAPTAAATPPGPPSAPQLDLATQRVRVCAWVNGKPLFEGELHHFADGELLAVSRLVEPERSVKTKDILKKALKQLIDQEVVYQDAVRKLEKTSQYLDKLKEGARKEFNKWAWKARHDKNLSEEEFKKILELQGTSLEDIYRQRERSFIVGEYLRSRAGSPTDKVGHHEILEYWTTHQNEFQSPDRVEWEDIFILVGTKKVPTLAYARTLADWVAKQLAAGAPIEKLLQYDDGDSSTRKGRGNGERRGDIRPVELEKSLFAMKPGDVAQPVEMATGIHVFRLAKREYAHQMPFNAEVQAKIGRKLKNDIYNRELERIIRQLANQTVIEVDPEVFK